MSSRLESWTTHTLPLGTEWTHISTRQLKSAVSNYIALTFTSLGFYSSLTFQQQRTYITINIQQSLAFLSLQTLWYIIISGMLVLSTRYLISNRNLYLSFSLNAELSFTNKSNTFIYKPNIFNILKWQLILKLNHLR